MLLTLNYVFDLLFYLVALLKEKRENITWCFAETKSWNISMSYAMKQSVQSDHREQCSICWEIWVCGVAALLVFAIHKCDH